VARYRSYSYGERDQTGIRERPTRRGVTERPPRMESNFNASGPLNRTSYQRIFVQ